MNLAQVHIVRLQALQALVQLEEDLLAREPLAVRFVAGEDELKRRLRTHLIPYARLAVGYSNMPDDKRLGRVKNDYDTFLSARAEVLTKAAHRACEGKSLELGELLNDAD